MRGLCATDWAETQGVSLKYKAPHQKAWIEERHNEMLRHSLHTTESQLIKEERRVGLEHSLAAVTFAHNALTVINGATPYQALFGRQPAMLPAIEGGWNANLADERGSVAAALSITRACEGDSGSQHHRGKRPCEDGAGRPP